MRWLPALAVIGQIAVSGAPTLPLRHFEANIIPLAITEDREGLLWIATPGALLRFDGLHFDPVQAPAEIDLSQVTHLAAGANGSIWIGTETGLLEYRDGRFTRRLPGSVRALAVTRGGRVMASVAPLDDIFVFMQPESNYKYVRLRDVVVNGNFTVDTNGVVWFGCRVRVCAWSDTDLNAAGNSFWGNWPRFMATMGTGKTLVFSWADVVATSDHSIWGRMSEALLQLDKRQDEFHVVSRSELPIRTFAGVRPRFFMDRRGRLWLPNRKLQVVYSGTVRLYPDAGAPLENVTAVFEDRQGTLWFGLAGKGLAALPDDSVVETYSEAEGIPGSTLDLIRHPRLGLLAATDQGAYAFDENRKRWRRAGPAEDRAALRSVVTGPGGALLSASYHGGLLLSEPPFRAARQIHFPAGFGPKRIRRLFADGHGTVWLGVLDGLLRLSAGDRVEPVPLPAGGAYASDILTDPAGTLWVGYEGGIARCATDGCTQVISEDRLLDRKVRTIAPGENEVWVCYRASGGFSRLSRRGGQWIATHFRPADGYGPADTDFLRRDSRGWVWRGTEEGVYVCDGIHTAPEDWLHLTFGDRANSSNANIYPFREEEDGSIWIGTQAGVVHVRPRPDWFARAIPRIASVAPAGTEFHLSYPGMQPFQSRLFRYRLLPVDATWRINSSGTLRYPTPRPAAYRLQVASAHGSPAAEYAFRQGSDLAWPRWIWIGIALGLAAGLVPALVRRRRSAQKARAAVSYWEEKRKFMEETDDADPEEPPVEDWSGQSLDGRFLLQARIARGGFAAVYRAVDLDHDNEPVAVKLLHPLRDHADWRRRRFRDEVAALQKLRHPGIVRIRHAGEASTDRPYLVMEFIDGITLRDLMADGPLELQQAANLLGQIGEALAAAHHAGILHRDLKPENVMVLDAGSARERIKLIDFGIAHAEADRTRTHSTQLAGSPGYVAPERWVGRESYASDIFSLAAVASEILTGYPAAHQRDSFGRPVAPLPANLLDLLSAGLAYEPEKRPTDPAVFARELSRCLLNTGT